MTTATSSTRVRHDSDAVFREWAVEFHDQLVAVGCVQTADTGQMNFTTVVRAGTNADAGYTLYYINDALHATAPIYFKIYWGTGAAVDRMRIRLEVGVGTNGTGSITGGNTVYTSSSTFATGLTTDAAYPNYVCLANGCLSAYGKVGRPAANFTLFGFLICRTTDTNGDADANGFLVFFHSAATSSSTFADYECYDYVHGSWNTRVTAGLMIVVPTHNATSGVNNNGDTEVVICHLNFDRIRPLASILGVCANDFTLGGTYSATPMGTTSRGYICAANWLGSQVSHVSGVVSNNYGLLTIWE